MTKKEKELELIEFKLDDGCELKAVSIVKKPAIDKQFMLFKTEEIFSEGIVIERFATTEEKKEITGVVMTPDKPILRKKADTGVFYNAWFSEETIKSCMEDFMTNGKQVKANFDHMQDSFTDQVKMIECWQVVDPANDTALAKGLTDLKKGEWVITYKVYDDSLWSSIKEEGFKGFSIEGTFGMYSAQDKNIEDKIKTILFSSLSDIDKDRMLSNILKNI